MKIRLESAWVGLLKIIVWLIVKDLVDSGVQALQFGIEDQGVGFAQFFSFGGIATSR